MSVSLYGSGQTVLQVVQGTTTSTTTTTSASFVATNLTATITPQSTNSKILIEVSGALDSAATNSQAVATIYRNNTTNLSNAAGFTNIFSSAGRVIGSAAMIYLDSPSTTSATTYTVYILGSNGSSIVFPQAGVATITLVEISGS
jgi:hypothetical protein